MKHIRVYLFLSACLLCASYKAVGQSQESAPAVSSGNGAPVPAQSSTSRHRQPASSVKNANVERYDKSKVTTGKPLMAANMDHADKSKLAAKKKAVNNGERDKQSTVKSADGQTK